MVGQHRVRHRMLGSGIEQEHSTLAKASGSSYSFIIASKGVVDMD